MSRGLSDDLLGAIEEQVVRPFLAVRIELPDPVYVWTGFGLLEFDDADGNPRTWLGTGQLGSLDTVGESTDGSATGIKVALYNVPSDFRDEIADQAERGVTFELYAGALDETFQVVTATQLIWKGRLAEYKISDAGTTIAVEITGESRAIDQRRPAIKRFTDEYQQRMYPGDLFFEYVSRMTEVQILWAQGEQSAVVTGGVSGSGGIGGSLLRQANQA